MNDTKAIAGSSIAVANSALLRRNAIINIEGRSGMEDGSVATFSLNDELLSRHMLVLGGTGSGKTTFLKSVIKQLYNDSNATNDSIIIFDTKGDFYNSRQQFNISDTDSVIIGKMRSDRTKYWNIFYELMSGVMKGETPSTDKLIESAFIISSCLFQELIEKETHQPFFPIAARDIFMGSLVVLIKDCIAGIGTKKPTNMDLKKYLLNFKTEEAMKKFSEIPELSWLTLYLEKNAKAMAQSVVAMLFQVVQTAFNNEFLQQGDFSIRDFVTANNKQVLFVEYDISTADMFIPIYRTLFDLAIREVLSRTKKKGNVYFIIDEFRLLPYLQFMDNAVNFGREKGLRMIVGLQSVEQLYSVYEEPRAKNILSGFSTMVSFRPNDYNTRAYVSERSGKNFTVTKHRDGNDTRSYQREGYCIEDWELSSLTKGQGVVVCPDSKPFVFQFPDFNGGSR
ncbi:hypothetical protein FACS1894219_04460 [Clostridia bacterium]|nr:hypothetical protein FACS1894219_04460 [Clostridia bacterium]